MAGGPAQSSPAASGNAGRRPWRGAAPQEAPRHRWQQEGKSATAAHTAWRSRRKLIIGALFAGSGLLLAFLVWNLLYAPVQTPLIAIAATGYEWPLPPNSWASEDVQGLEADLHRRTVKLTDLSSEWRTADRGLSRLDEELKRIAKHPGRARSAIFYLSMYGAIDGGGRACLVPPGTNPLDSSTWLPLAEVLARIKRAELPAAMHKLVVLDSSRELTSGPLGQLGGGFAEALPQAVADAEVSNLAILNSTSAGEAAIASPLLRGSLLGHYLRLGLAGAADQSDFGGRTSGNGNGRVTLQELQKYLARHAQAWSKQHAGQPQTPSLVPPTADFDVAWTLRTSGWRDLVARARRVERAEPSVATEIITALWRQHDELRSARPWRFDPLGWRDLEHRLLALEQLTSAGKAYEERASSLAARLAADLEQATQRHAEAQRRGSWPAYAAILAGSTNVPPVQTHSLPLAAYWGSADADVIRSLQTQLTQTADEPSSDRIQQALAAFAAANLPAVAEEANFLAIWQRQHVPSLWREAAPLQQLLNLRQQSESHAVPLTSGGLPGDERAHAWTRQPLLEIDHARRELEDAVALGPQPGTAQPSGADAIAGLQNLSLGQLATDAYALRDEVLAELPYLSAWLCRPQYDAARQDAADLLIRQSLVPLITAVHKLEQELHRADLTAEAAPRVWTADSPLSIVRERWAELKTHLQAALDRLSAQPDEAQAVADIEALLTLPFIPWDTRQQLARERQGLQTRLAAEYDDPYDGVAETAAPAAAVASQLARVARWRSHPLPLLLSAAVETEQGEVATNSVSEQLARIGRWGELTRRELASLSHTGTDRPGDRPARFTAEKPVAAGLDQLCQAESRLRAGAGLWFPRPGVDPVRELRRADLQELMLWRARRALDDFYGPARSGREPFFAVAAADYLAAARALGPLCEAMASEAAALDALLARRRIAARDALAVSATDLLLVDQAASIRSTIAVTPRTPEAIPDLPPATAAVFLADDAGRIGPASAALELPPPGVTPDQPLLREASNLDSAALRNRGPILQAVASVRGNDYVSPVLLRAPGGVLVEFRPPVYGPPQVTVLGYERKRASVVFILDSSHSMQTPIAVESPGPAARTQATRMEVAKGALRALLGDMAEQGTVRVGVRLFGHRVGWSTTEADKLLRQTAYGDDIPAALRPYADVENILPLGRFDSLAAGRVFDKLQNVKPWGESPLYLALQQAIGDFGPDDNASRSIVLITDGQNYQFNPPREFQPALADVLAAAQRAQVAIHVVGFDAAAEDAQARNEFNEIASRTGGSFAPAASATSLLESLQRLLRPGEFRVLAASGSEVGVADLGQPVVLRDHQGRRRYDVRFEHLREPVELAGGEAVEIAVRRGEPRLEVVPFLKGNPRFEPLITTPDGSPTPLRAGLHRAVRTPEGVQFPLSVQDRDGHFVPRPVELWVEITPVGLPPESSPGPYIFFDAPFAANTTVPLAALLARHWPAAAAQAEVQVWMKNTATPPGHEVPLAEVADRLPAEGGGFTIPSASGISYQVRTAGGTGEALVIGLIERHERAETVGSLKVALTPAASHATHQFDRQNRIVLHTFTFEQPASDLRGRIGVQFTSRSACQQQAWQTAQPVLADVADRADLLELTPAAR